MNADIYAVHGEGLNIAKLRCNIWSLIINWEKNIFFTQKTGKLNNMQLATKAKKRKSADRRKSGIPGLQTFIFLFTLNSKTNR